MKSAPALLSASLEVHCPYCDSDPIDLFDEDEPERYLHPIFSNEWDKCIGEEVTCPNCGNVFTVEVVEW